LTCDHNALIFIFPQKICDDNFFICFYKKNLSDFYVSIVYTKMLTLKSQKNVFKLTCDSCDYSCSKKSDYDKHLLTRKHIKANCDSDNANIKSPKEKIYSCNNCGVAIKHLSSLSRHKKKCLTELNAIVENEPSADDLSGNEIKILSNLVFEIFKSNNNLQKQCLEFQKQNQDLQKQMLDVCKNSNNTSNSHNNNNNKTFNLQFFLNEQCKDAMNIMDFVNTFQLQFSDLERIGEVGYVEGISNIIIDKLNEMDVYKRPIHCSDAKREIMHIKDNDVWAKDTPTNDKLRLAIKHITKKNSDMIRPWANAHPGVLNSEHRLNDKYQEMIIEAMGGNSGTLKECETKIIKKISKMVVIDKKV